MKIMTTKFIKSPNYSERDGQQVLCIVCHITDGDKRSVISHFTNPASKVSAHYLVTRAGDIIQFVDERFAAWHSGYRVNPTAKLALENPDINFNKLSIGIEHEAFSNQDLTEVQYVSSAKLISEICQRYAIPKDREHILKHREIRSSKFCPGIISIEKIIGLTFNPPTINEIELLKVKISLLQRLLELLKSLSSFQRLGGSDDEKGEL